MKPAETGHVKKTLTVSHYFNIGFGAIVGTGWILMVGTGSLSEAARWRPCWPFCWAR